jgi:gluconate 2-dehydrogenase gamma chain
MTETRRHALKMLGTIGLTCAFPFPGDELYGQHVHATLAQAPGAAPYTPTFFTPVEYSTLSRLSDLIIPATNTPGASAAGVPEYIDRVVSLNAEHQALMREGLAWLDQQARAQFARDFLSLDDASSVSILQPLSDEVDRRQREARQRRFRTDAKGALVYYVALTDRDPQAPPAGDNLPNMPVRLFRLVKNLTADGYYTSRAGLIDELGYTGNTALASFPACTVREH